MVEAVAIYVGGRTGPQAAAGQQLVEIAPCDETLPQVVATLIRNMEQGSDPLPCIRPRWNSLSPQQQKT